MSSNRHTASCLCIWNDAFFLRPDLYLHIVLRSFIVKVSDTSTNECVYFFFISLHLFFFFVVLIWKMSIVILHRYQWTYVFILFCSMLFSTKQQHRRKKEQTSTLHTFTYTSFVFAACRVTTSSKNNSTIEGDKKRKKNERQGENKKTITMRLSRDLLVLSKYEYICYWHTKGHTSVHRVQRVS